LCRIFGHRNNGIDLQRFFLKVTDNKVPLPDIAKRQMVQKVALRSMSIGHVRAGENMIIIIESLDGGS
jgi:hypothetical protein